MEPMDDRNEEREAPISADVARVLVDNHRAFLAFLEKRVESRAAAEEILQNAFVRGVEKGGALRDDESAVAWFYRLLRNAVVDHYRRRGAHARALEREAREQESREAFLDPEETERVLCACMGELIPTLKDEYEEVLRLVDLEGRSLADAAHTLGITTNNATVRLHRARQALKKRLEATCRSCAEHGCLDCTCERPEAGGCEHPEAPVAEKPGCSTKTSGGSGHCH